ncbi:MAG: amino acid carrier protein [Pseudohongiella sp.]|nr:amino acid carrier protein [Pseudohongiella sp.]
MQSLFDNINTLFAFIQPVSDAVWAFPTQFAFYSAIPIIGQMSMAVLLLLGMGLVFTIKTGVVQTFSFAEAYRIITRQHQVSATGISPKAAFLLGLAMRVGPGNIVGVTGAISVGGPGALFWMWVAALLGMASAFTESVLSQLYKEKKDQDFVGGLPFYGRSLLGGKRFVGIFLSIAFIVYALFNLPAQTFNVFTAFGMIAETVTGNVAERQSPLYFSIAIMLVISTAWMILGGIRRVTRYTNVMVPVMAVVFCALSLLIILLNATLIPTFFREVFTGAFSPDALFGGAIGVAIAEGVRRGLMSNEAGQGTITMAAAAAHNRHPCEQGFVQSLGVFVDTIVICTLSGFIVVIAQLWQTAPDAAAWSVASASRIGTYLGSVQYLTPAWLSDAATIVLSLCYSLFAFTTLLGMISFAEISANFISRSARFILVIRLLGAMVFVPFGAMTVLAGLELGNLWAITDLTNIVMVYLNIPLLILGAPIVLKALNHYKHSKGGSFNSAADIGVDTAYWR